MGKRYTDTELYDHGWFRKLPPRIKCAWDWLCKRCDVIGLWNIDIERLSFEVGETVTLDELKEHFKVQVLGDKLFIPGFVAFQYGDEAGRLSLTNKFHQSIIRKLEAKGLPLPVLKGVVSVPTPLPSPVDTVSTGDASPQGKGKGQGQGKGIGKVEGGVGETKPTPRVQDLVAIWNAKCPPLLPCADLTYSRSSFALQRLREQPDLTYWQALVDRIANSPHCTGKTKASWKANFDWFLSELNAIKVLEGQYDKHEAEAAIDWGALK